MPTRIDIVNGVIIAVCVEVKSVRSFGINIFSTIWRDKSTPLGIIVSRIEVVKSCFAVEIVSSVTNRISSCKIVRNAVDYATVTPCVVGIFNLSVTVCIIDGNNVTMQISEIIINTRSVYRRGVLHTHHRALVVEEYDLR